MQRRTSDEPVEDFFRQDLESKAEALKQNLLTWRERSVKDLAALRPPRVHGLRDRTNEVWRPLFSLSPPIGNWDKRAQAAAIALARAAEPSPGVLLLEDIRTVFDEHGLDKILTVGLLDFLYLIEEAPWAEWWQDTKGAPRRMAKLLKPYGIESKTMRTEDGRGHGYEREQFLDAWKRFLSDPQNSVTSVTSVTSLQIEVNESGGIGDTSRIIRDNEGGWD